MRTIPVLLLSLLLCPARAAEGDSPAEAAPAAKAKAAKPKAGVRPKLKKVKWLWGQSTVKSQMAALDAGLKEQEPKNAKLEGQVRETKARIARLEGRSYSAQPSAEPAEQGQPSQPGQGGPSAAPAAPSPAGAPPSTPAQAKELKEAKAALAKQEAALKDAQGFSAQLKSAKQELEDATGGSEDKLKDLLSGDLAKLTGVYAQRVKLDQDARTEIVPSGPCGDYPVEWCKAPPNARITFGGRWFLNRQCVAYAAWKRWRAGKPFATGDAGDWPGNSGRPTVGAVAIWNRGTVGKWGHVAIVTAVAADSITISEFNWRPFLHTNRRIGRGGGWPSRFWN